MPSQKNIDRVLDLSDKLSKAKAVILADYSGLSVADQSKLRKQIIDSGGEFLVAKNRLFKLALSKTKNTIPEEIADALKGPTGFLFAFEDEIGVIKSLFTFSQENDLPKTKIGIIFEPEDRILDIAELERLSKLPSQQELALRLITTLNSPGVRLVNSLSGNLRKLIFVLKAIKNNKSKN